MEDGYIKFEYKFSDTYPKITYEIDSESTATNVVKAFVEFMKAVGYAHSSIRSAMEEVADDADILE